MGRMKDLAIEEQERQLRFPDMDEMPQRYEYQYGDTIMFHRPTSLMEIQYEESLDRLCSNYHLLTNEEIEIINKIANRII